MNEYDENLFPVELINEIPKKCGNFPQNLQKLEDFDQIQPIS